MDQHEEVSRKLLEDSDEDLESEGEHDSSKKLNYFSDAQESKRKTKELPIVSAGILSYITTHWATQFMYDTYRRGFSKENLFDTHWTDSSEYNCQRFEGFWRDEISTYGKSKASVARAVFKMVRGKAFLATILYSFVTLVAVLGPAVPLKILTDSLSLPEGERPGKLYLIGMAAMLVACQLVIAIIVTSIKPVMMAREGCRVKAGVLSFVFKQIINKPVAGSRSVGEVINLCANDGDRLIDLCRHGVGVTGMVGCICGVVYSMFLLGPWGLLGFTVFFLFFPIQILMGRLTFHLRCKSIPITEKRVRLMSELVTAIKLVKMYAWDKSFATKIHDVRNEEKKALGWAMWVKNISIAISQLIAVSAAFFTFLAMTDTGYSLTVSQAFVFVSLLNSLRFAQTMMPYSVKAVAEGYHGCLRIQKVLLDEKERHIYPDTVAYNHFAEVKEASFGWPIQSQKTEGSTQDKDSKETDKLLSDCKNESSLCDSDEELERKTVILHDITLTVKTGMTLGVCGSVGSGKTSVLQALLGMMDLETGVLRLNSSKNIAYVPQQAWILNATAKENILFGNPYDKTWYDKVITACALLSDFEQLPAGDRTEIGERGINLSGGQKQRISMARAVYSLADVVLLDDPLSAVDAQVGQHMMTHCIKDLLKNKTVIFVTHQLQFLSECDYIIVMKDGRIVEEGTHQTLLENGNGEYANLRRSFQTSTDDALRKCEEIAILDRVELKMDDNLNKQTQPIKVDEQKDASQLNSNHDGKLTKEEKLEEGEVSLKIYKDYINAAGGSCVFLIVIFLVVLAMTTQAFSNYWLSIWLSAGSGNFFLNKTITRNDTLQVTRVLSESILDNPNIGFYQLIYGTSLLVIILVIIIKSQIYVRVSLKAASNLHNNLFSKVVRAPMRFFDETPSGQILNRFSRDMDIVDTVLPVDSELFFNEICTLLLILGIIGSVFPYFLLCMLPVAVIFVLGSRFSQLAIRSTKRVENITRSPLFSHIAMTIQGLDSIKAYKNESRFLKQFNDLQDCNNMAMFLFHTSIRWTACRLEVLTVSVLIGMCFFVIYVPSDVVSPSLAALALSYALNMTGIFQYTLRFWLETEARFTPVERIQSYVTGLASEAPPIIEGRQPKSSWPEEGAIQFENVNVRYREGLPLVLKNISLDIKPQEKIGIVGRTGSGKSSLAMALFRMMELDSGSISIDGIDISTIGLESLRSKLSIIPQDPVLFVGTVRYNLDPFNSYTDEEIWSALGKCHMKQTALELEGQLDALVVENGENFSVGERQLLCMARALLRHSKILVLDEATAAIDTETDSLVQETIKEAFSDCTMLTIAHRLNTVANCDRILVLHDGQIIEFDSPANLLANEMSTFSQMLRLQKSQAEESS